jgi:choline dehydrogenase-like flavoprotein
VRELTIPHSESLSDRVLADDAALDARIAEKVGSSSHGMGTCRLGQSSDPLAVVDDHCRVHGLERLRVVDASIAPSVPRANAHSTVLMIGERVAALLRTEA